MTTSTCKECGAPTLWIHTYNGRRMPFDAEPVNNPKAPDSMRWYVERKRGAMPGTLVTRPATERFLTLHQCRRTRLGIGAPDLSGFEISNSTGPRVPTVDLDPRFTFAYRWPTSWAHVVYANQTLCGAARMLERMSEAEQRRLQQMPVCPKCLTRYPDSLARRIRGGYGY